MMKNKPEYEVFNQKFAGWLMQRGFVLLKLKPNRDGSGRNVFIFRDTLELHRAVDEYLRK